MPDEKAAKAPLMEQRVTFCPRCGEKIVVTLCPPCQLTICHLEPLCSEAENAFDGLSCAAQKFMRVEDLGLAALQPMHCADCGGLLHGMPRLPGDRMPYCHCQRVANN